MKTNLGWERQRVRKWKAEHEFFRSLTTWSVPGDLVTHERQVIDPATRGITTVSQYELLPQAVGAIKEAENKGCIFDKGDHVHGRSWHPVQLTCELLIL